MSRLPVLATLIAAWLGVCGSPAPAQPSTPRSQPQPLVMGEIHTLSSRVLGADRRIVVRTPAGYGDQPTARYNVVYVIDGGPEQDFPHLAGLVQSAEVNGTFDPFIIVGIETVKRREEITPPVADTALYLAELAAKPGGSALFRRFIAQEVKPWVEARYRTSGRDGVIGESLAGLFVVETLFEAPDLFDDFIAVSPSLWWENMRYGRNAAAYLARLPKGDRRLYLTLADEGYRHAEGVDRLVAALKARSPAGLQWLYVAQENSETHASIYHGAALDAFRAFYGTPARLYLPTRLLSGRPMRARSPAENARRGRECTRGTARATTPRETKTGHDAIAYECLLYELGPAPTAGNFKR